MSYDWNWIFKFCRPSSVNLPKEIYFCLLDPQDQDLTVEAEVVLDQDVGGHLIPDLGQENLVHVLNQDQGVRVVTRAGQRVDLRASQNRDQDRKV